MKMKLIAAAVATLAAAPAFALNTSDTAAAINAGRVVYASGASAPTNIVWRGFASQCQTGTLDAYSAADLTAASKPGASAWGNFLAYSCKLKAGATGTAWDNQNVAFMHTVDGGSINSLYGMSSDTNQQVKFIVDALTNCAASGFNTTDSGLSVPIYEKCSTAKKKSHGGFSDVEKQMWSALFNTNPPVGLNVGDVEVLGLAAGQAFGVAVSKSLYVALQTEQGLTATGCTGDSVTAACQPSITKRDYASIVNADPFSVTKVDWSFLLPTTGTGMAVNLCRRVDTSGTQASSNVYFMANPCASFAEQTGQRYPASVADEIPGAFHVVEGSGTGDVKKCLSGNATYGTTASDFSIGVISAENNPTVPSSSTDSWRFVKLDGISIYDGAGNRANVLNGKYDFAYELALHTHPTLTPANSKALMSKVAEFLGDASAPAIDGLYRVADAKGTRGGNACQPFAY